MTRLATLRTSRPDSVLTDTERAWLQVSYLAAHRDPKPWGTYAIDVKVAGAAAPAPLLQACTNPGWIALQCHHGNFTATPVRCRTCDACKHAWRAKVRALIIQGSTGFTTYMWTLTIPEYPIHMKENRFDFAQTRWHDLLRHSHKTQIRFRYLRVVELQKRGTPHFHLAVNAWTHHGRALLSTRQVRQAAIHLAKHANFGYVQGKTMDIQPARLGPAGVASYMSKYLEKSDDYNLMRRDDGRAIRRYNRSYGWGNPTRPPTWRWAIIPHSFSRTPLSQKLPSCNCTDRQLLIPQLQIRRWLLANRRSGQWVAPNSIGDYILAWEKENNRPWAFASLNTSVHVAYPPTHPDSYTWSHSSQVKASSASNSPHTVPPATTNPSTNQAK